MGPSWRCGKLGGIAYLLEDDLPYPCAIDSSSRESLSLDGEWELAFDPGEAPGGDGPGGDVAGRWAALDWEPTRVPSVYNAAKSPHRDYLGIVWYRRGFRLPRAAAEGESLRLCLEGALLRGALWLNGEFRGSFEGGYTPRYFDIGASAGTDNSLVVMTDNRLTRDSLPMAIRREHNPGWHTYGGLYRSVSIEYLPPSYFVRARARAESLPGGSSRVVVEALVWEGPGARAGAEALPALEASLSGPAGDELRLTLESVAAQPGVSAASASLRAWRGSAEAESLRPWSPGAPSTYRLSLRLAGPGGDGDSIALTTGFRDFRVEGESFVLNGESVFLKGICKHEDHPELGASQTEELIEGDLGLVRDLGANYLRLAHYPHDTRELARARDLGIMVSGEIPLYQAGAGFTAWFQEKRPLRDFPLSLFGLRQLASPALIDNARRQLAEMIIRDGNNPAIIFWSVGNECYSLGPRAGRIFSGLRDTAKFFDSDRPVTNVELTYHIPMLDALKRGWRDMDFYCLNSYFGWYYGSPEELPSFLSRAHRRWKGKPLLLSEFGADAALGRRDSDGPWKAERVSAGRTYSEEYQESLISGYCAAAADQPWVRGLSPWILADFYNTWFPHNPVPNYNLKGLVSADRAPKAAYGALKEIYRDGSL
jgi:beta-glucuronidase